MQVHDDEDDVADVTFYASMNQEMVVRYVRA